MLIASEVLTGLRQLYGKTNRTVWVYQQKDTGGVSYLGLEKETTPTPTHPRNREHTLYGYIDFNKNAVVQSGGETKKVSTIDWHQVGRMTLNAVLVVAKLMLLTMGLAVVLLVAILGTSTSRRS